MGYSVYSIFDLNISEDSKCMEIVRRLGFIFPVDRYLFYTLKIDHTYVFFFTFAKAFLIDLISQE